MPTKEWNLFYRGLGKDDFIQQDGEVLEMSNLDWVRDGYGITLWLKAQKAFTTVSAPLNVYEYPTTNTPDLARSLVFCSNGEIYQMNASDNTPVYTMTSSRVPIAALEWVPKLYVVYKDSLSADTLKLMEVDTTIGMWDWTIVNETFNTNIGSHYDIPPIINAEWVYYVWVVGWLTKISTLWVETNYSLVHKYVTGLTRHWTTLYLYCSDNTLALVLAWALTVSQTEKLGFLPIDAQQNGGIDYVRARNGGVYQVGWENSGNIAYKRISNRWTDNSQYLELLNFNKTDDTGSGIAVYQDDVFFVNNWNQTSIVKYGNVFNGLPFGLHNILSKNNAGTAIDEIYWLRQFRNTTKLYFWYKAGATYWVDYIDLDAQTTYTDGYFVTGIFRWPPNKRNQLSELRYTTSNTNGANYIKIYKRINNWAWTEIVTVNNSTATISRDKMTINDEFVDCQFKVEFHNDDGGSDRPTLHHLEIVYSIIWE